MCWSIASFRHTSGHGDEYTILKVALWTRPWNTTSYGAHGDSISYTHTKFLLWDFSEEQRFSHKWETSSKNRHQNRKNELNPNKSMCWQCCTTARMTTCGSRIPCYEEKSDANWLTLLLNNGEWFHTKSWCCGQNVKGKTHIQDW